jgi:hypothetical protein
MAFAPVERFHKVRSVETVEQLIHQSRNWRRDRFVLVGDDPAPWSTLAER